MAAVSKKKVDLASYGDHFVHPELSKLSYKEFEELHEKQFAEIEKASDDAIAKGELVNRLVYFPVADGAACYRVDSVKPLKLAHVPYGDAYEITGAYFRGLRLEDIQHQANW